MTCSFQFVILNSSVSVGVATHLPVEQHLVHHSLFVFIFATVLFIFASFFLINSFPYSLFELPYRLSLCFATVVFIFEPFLSAPFLFLYANSRSRPCLVDLLSRSFFVNLSYSNFLIASCCAGAAKGARASKPSPAAAPNNRGPPPKALARPERTFSSALAVQARQRAPGLRNPLLLPPLSSVGRLPRRSPAQSCAVPTRPLRVREGTQAPGLMS